MVLFLAAAQDPTVTITESDPLAKLSQTGFQLKGLNGGLIQVKRDSDVTMSCYVENKQVDTLVRCYCILELIFSSGSRIFVGREPSVNLTNLGGWA